MIVLVLETLDYGIADALRRLLESGATVEEVNRQDDAGRTALYLTCDAGHSC